MQKAVRKDPRRCVIAQACRRLFGATTVLIFRSIAYVDLPDENGKHTVNRVTVDPTCRRRLEGWDKTGTPFTGGCLLRAPRKSTRLDVMRHQAKKYQTQGYTKTRRNKAYVKGHAIEIAAADHELRSVGSGLVQMLKTGKSVATI